MNIGRYRVWLGGPPLVGFFDLFDSANGDPKTPKPYMTVKPAVVGGVLLPFACPHCDAVKPEMVHPRRSIGYRDSRGFSWCPGCKKRYVLDEKGSPLTEEIAVGATHAPALVVCGERTAIVGGKKSTDGLKVLGTVS